MEIVKDIEIDVGHRILQHESKCRHVHGHRLRIRIHASAEKLDTVGRIVDFGVIKEVIGGWLNNNLDHVFVANPQDPILNFLEENKLRHYVMEFPATEIACKHMLATSPKPPTSNWRLFVEQMYTSETQALEPTSENLARMIYEKCLLLTFDFPKLRDISINQIEVYETPSSSASFTSEDMKRVWDSYFNSASSPIPPAPWYSKFLP